MLRAERLQKVSGVEGLTGGDGGMIFNTNDLEVAPPHSPAFRRRFNRVEPARTGSHGNISSL